MLNIEQNVQGCPSIPLGKLATEADSNIKAANKTMLSFSPIPFLSTPTLVLSDLLLKNFLEPCASGMEQLLKWVKMEDTYLQKILHVPG